MTDTRMMHLETLCGSLEQRVNLAYRQRNDAAIALVKMALMLGWPAGWGIDNKADNDIEWRHVVYVDLPNGEQVSYHMSPEDVIHLEGLPTYRGTWDGKFTGTTTWHSMLEVKEPEEAVTDVETYAMRKLSGMPLRRWCIEQAKLKADEDVSEADANRILLGYAKAWGR